MQDISERKGAEEKLAYQASHDHLTDLPNRILLADGWRSPSLASAAWICRSAILFCDLDRFKLVNDSFGHDAGDRLLLEARSASAGSSGPATRSPASAATSSRSSARR